ncbi:MAG: hypothetical protein ACOVOR_01030 [Rhabdochlamydiaceae bacterium]
MSITTKKPKIVVDFLGADTDPSLLLPQFLALIAPYPDKKKSSLILIIPSHLTKLVPKGLQTIPCEEAISMQDDPLVAAKRKKQSSIWKGINTLKLDKADAFISAGNTGAIITIATISLPLLDKITKPALIALIPSEKNSILLLDVGATIRCSPKQFLELAYMGTLVKQYLGVLKPKISLLNIGKEKTKGSQELKQAFSLLEQLNTHTEAEFIGNIEARDIFKKPVDIILTDGFTGNVLLKTAEGISQTICETVAHLYPQDKRLESLKEKFLYTQYAGAIIGGFNKILIKCHGDSQGENLVKSVEQAFLMLESDFFKHQNSSLLSQIGSFL